MIAGAGMTPHRRFLLYCQHLSGSGHFVRTYEIARSLAEGNEVHLVDGGRPVPRPPLSIPISRLTLPRIYRGRDAIAPVDASLTIDAVMRDRVRLLTEGIHRIRPDAVVIEYFPFSKWLLYPEIIAAIEAARTANAGVKIVCSLRDVSFRTRDDPQPERHRRNVLETLHRHFDAVLVHADPAVMRIESHIPWAGEIRIPLRYTGYVSEKPAAGPSPSGAGTVIASGGGAGWAGLITHCMAAWKRLLAEGATGGRRLAIFAPLFLPEGDLADLEQKADGEYIRCMPFAADFLQWMKTADLSVSQAGYNTCTNILETRVRAVLVPNPSMSDQAPRARRLAELGLATVVDPAELDADRLRRAIIEALTLHAPQHAVDLDGAATTRRLLEDLCGHGA